MNQKEMSMATVAEQTITDQGVQLVPLALVQASKTNPRKHFNKAALDELTASVAQHGILQPLLVRPRAADGYELVVGERRWRAAKAAGLKAVPALVREFSDAEALEVQVVENLQRTDLHPLEEAEGYEQLQKLHGHTVEDLAAKVGKSKAYIYARMKLCALVPEARKAFYDDKVSASTALLVARIPVPELQLEALRHIIKPNNYRPESLSYREAVDYVQRTFMLRLAEAGFSTSDSDLVPAAGPCTTCPKRTGNQRELFGDVKSADVCTDPKCFDSKREAAWAREKAAAEARGTKVLEDGAAKKLFPHGDRLTDRSGFVDLAGENYDDPKSRRWGQVLGKAAEEHVVLARDAVGGLHRLVPKDQLPQLLKAVGASAAPRVAASSRESARLASRAKAERAKTIIENKARARSVAEIRSKVATPLKADDLRLVAESLFGEMHHESRKGLFDCIELPITKGSYGYDLATPFRKFVAGLDWTGLSGLLVVMSISPRDYWQGRRDPIGDVAKRYKVDLARIRKDVVAESKKPSGKKPGGKKRAKAAARA